MNQFIRILAYLFIALIVSAIIWGLIQWGGSDRIKADSSRSGQVQESEKMLEGDIVEREETRTEGDKTIHSTRYYTKDGKPAAAPGGYFEIREELKGNPGEKDFYSVRSFLDANGNLTRNGPGGISKFKVSAIGDTSILEYFDENDQPFEYKAMFGTAKTEIIKDPETKEVVEIRQYGADGKLMLSNFGTAVEKITREQTPEGLVITNKYFGVNGEPVKFHTIIPWFKTYYNNEGAETGNQFINSNGEPCDETIGNIRFSKFVRHDGHVTLYDLAGKEVQVMNQDDFESFFEPWLKETAVESKKSD